MSFTSPFIEQLQANGWSEYKDHFRPVVPQIETRYFSKRYTSRYDCTLNRKGGVAIFVSVSKYRSQDPWVMELELYAEYNSQNSFRLTTYGLPADMINLDAQIAKMLDAWDAYCCEGHYEVKPDTVMGTFGGESYIDDMEFAEYGLDLGVVHVSKLSPTQAKQLATRLVDHLMLNGHRFEIQDTHEQDQRQRLVCIDERES